jgi:hypothetical protein
MRKTGRALVLAAMAAVTAGTAAPALAATARHAPGPRSAVAFTPGSGQSAVDWNRELITIPPPPITSAAYANALNQVKSLGQDSGPIRTADQTALAKFWGAAPIWNVWNQIAQKLAVTRQAKWRPVTAIRLGSTAGNRRIVGDPNWNPLAVTAADPSYPGAHAAISQAAANEATLSRLFAGQHTMSDLNAGQRLGRQVAGLVLGHFRPVGAR